MSEPTINSVCIRFLNNPSPFSSPIELEIRYQCSDNLREKIQWKLMYNDVLLKEDLDGLVYAGKCRFVLMAEAPDPSNSDGKQKPGPQALTLFGSYGGQTFLQVGYQMDSDTDVEYLIDESCNSIAMIERGIQWKILSEAPTFTMYPINFHPENAQSAVEFSHINFLESPAPFNSPIRLEISYVCTADRLTEAIHWKLIYLQNSESDHQLIAENLEERVLWGERHFVLNVDDLVPTNFRKEFILGPQTILLSGSYAGQKFLEVYYHVHNEYDDEGLRKEPPLMMLADRVRRTIFSDRPRITKFPINFHLENAQSGGQAAPDGSK